MSHSFTSEQIAALKPDDASLKAAKGLLNKKHWNHFGQNDLAIWGECQGSGSKPYLVQMRVADWVFKCTCPSRKFPCKHGLALGFLYADNTADFNTGDTPAWVQEWLAASTARTEKKRTKEQDLSEEDQAKKTKQAEKRREQKQQRLQDGLEELQLWLVDQMRYGLNRLPQQLGQIKQIAARMVDAQMPLVAKRLQDVHDQVGIKPDWTLQTLKVFGQLQLLIEAMQRFDQLSPLEQADLLDALGVNNKDATQQPLESIQDTWQVLGVTLVNVERQLWRRMVWLQGEKSQRIALLVDFNYGGSSFTPVFLEGESFTGTCHYFLSSTPLRAVVAEGQCAQTPAKPIAGYDLKSCLSQYAQRLAHNPWTWVSPWLLNTVWIVSNGKDFMATDQDQQLPLQVSEPDGWRLLAVAGTLPLTLFLQFVDDEFIPLSAWRETQLLWKNEAVKA